MPLIRICRRCRLHFDAARPPVRCFYSSAGGGKAEAEAVCAAAEDGEDSAKTRSTTANDVDVKGTPNGNAVAGTAAGSSFAERQKRGSMTAAGTSKKRASKAKKEDFFECSMEVDSVIGTSSFVYSATKDGASNEKWDTREMTSKCFQSPVSISDEAVGIAHPLDSELSENDESTRIDGSMEESFSSISDMEPPKLSDTLSSESANDAGGAEDSYLSMSEVEDSDDDKFRVESMDDDSSSEMTADESHKHDERKATIPNSMKHAPPKQEERVWLKLDRPQMLLPPENDVKSSSAHKEEPTLFFDMAAAELQEEPKSTVNPDAQISFDAGKASRGGPTFDLMSFGPETVTLASEDNKLPKKKRTRRKRPLLAFKYSGPVGEDGRTACRLCGSRQTKLTFRVHATSSHLPGRPFACLLCPHTARAKGAIKTHLRTIHDAALGPETFSTTLTKRDPSIMALVELCFGAFEEATYPRKTCQGCKVSVEANKTKVHISRAHLGSAVFVCRHCTYATTDCRASVMRSHVRKAHRRDPVEADFHSDLLRTMPKIMGLLGKLFP